jgi:magnesium transporter
MASGEASIPPRFNTGGLPVVDEVGTISHVSFETAAQHASTNVPIITSTQRVRDALGALTGRRYESASHLVVCDEDRFAGIMTIEALLAAPAESTVDAVMDRDAPTVRPRVDQEIATRAQGRTRVLHSRHRLHG